jgi:N-acetylglucosamine-6-phosphate deacetylase
MTSLNVSHQLGAHLEGPFIAHEKKGAHDPQVLQASVSGIDAMEKIYGPIQPGGPGCIITVAPELPGMLDCIKELSQRGVVVSLGRVCCGCVCACVSVARLICTHNRTYNRTDRCG